MGFGVGDRFVMHCLGSPILIFSQVSLKVCDIENRACEY